MGDEECMERERDDTYANISNMPCTTVVRVQSVELVRNGLMLKIFRALYAQAIFGTKRTKHRDIRRA